MTSRPTGASAFTKLTDSWILSFTILNSTAYFRQRAGIGLCILQVGNKPANSSPVFCLHHFSGICIQCCGWKGGGHMQCVCVCVCWELGRASVNEHGQRARSTSYGTLPKVPAITEVPFLTSNTMIPKGPLQK